MSETAEHLHIAADLIGEGMFREAVELLYFGRLKVGKLSVSKDDRLAADQAYADPPHTIRVGQRAFEGWGNEVKRWYRGVRCNGPPCIYARSGFDGTWCACGSRSRAFSV